MKTEREALKNCPECGSEGVTVTAEQMFLVNTGEHYCHSVKTQDSDAKARCIACGWVGEHKDLVGFGYD